VPLILKGTLLGQLRKITKGKRTGWPRFIVKTPIKWKTKWRRHIWN